MEITVFAKNATSKDGRKFVRFITRLTRKSTGETFTSSVKFREDAGVPTVCPCNIVIDKKDANLQAHSYTTNDGEEAIGYTLWVSKWTMSDIPYEDHSLDDF